MIRPWNSKTIIESNDPIVPLPKNFFRKEPHPYMNLGAPYGTGLDPWHLRKQVLKRLIKAQDFLVEEYPEFRLSLFDALRPIAVQKFMIEYTINKICLQRGFSTLDPEYADQLRDVQIEVASFWAEPSEDDRTPPPHSTGAAVDLTLADIHGEPINMGCSIDEIDMRAHPNYYAQLSEEQSSSAKLFNDRRIILFTAMTKAGFCQHPHEWWHFSFGDQLWAWRNNSNYATYGIVVTDSKL